MIVSLRLSGNVVLTNLLFRKNPPQSFPEAIRQYSLKSRGKQFVPEYLTRFFMWSDYIINNANEVCFAAALLVSVLFYRQYKKYEAEAEREEIIEKFLR